MSTHTALVTGASSGIGLALARLLAADGHDVLLTARNESALAELATELEAAHGVAATPLVCDLAAPGAAAELVGALRERDLRVDVLINNAGFGDFGPFADADADKQVGMLRVNVEALTHLTRLLLPDMLERGYGRILQVASTAGFLPGPLMAVYYASKAYVISLSEALATELDGSGVSVTCLCPGPTETSFQERAGQARTRLLQLDMMSAEAVAEQGYAGLKMGRRRVVPGWKNQVIAIVARMLPLSWSSAGAMRYQQQRFQD